jgi:hypothetical protein
MGRWRGSDALVETFNELSPAKSDRQEENEVNECLGIFSPTAFLNSVDIATTSNNHEFLPAALRYGSTKHQPRSRQDSQTCAMVAR